MIHRLSIIQHGGGRYTVAEEPIIGNPICTHVDGMKELCDTLSRLLSTDIEFYTNLDEWQQSNF